MGQKRYLVTGANGYIGRYVVNELLKHNYSVVALDVNFDGVSPNAQRLSANISDDSIDIFELAGKPDGMIHLAWRNGFKHNADTHFKDLAVHTEFIERMIKSGLKNITVMGSMHEVGYFEGAIKSDSPTNPLSLYAIAKNSFRQAIDVLTKDKDVSVKWLRGYYIYGDDQKSNSVLGKILMADKEGKKTFPFTSGKNLYDFISVEKLAEQIVAAAVQEKYTGIINCCTGNPVSLGEMAERFIKENNLSIKLEYGVYPDRPYDSPGVWGDATLINKIMAERKA